MDRTILTKSPGVYYIPVIILYLITPHAICCYTYVPTIHNRIEQLSWYTGCAGFDYLIHLILRQGTVRLVIT